MREDRAVVAVFIIGGPASVAVVLKHCTRSGAFRIKEPDKGHGEDAASRHTLAVKTLKVRSEKG